jgi:hypothetical protein
MAAESSYIKNNTHGSITLADATGSPVTLALAYDKGDLAISGLSQFFNEVVFTHRRGKRTSLANGDRRVPTASLSILMGNFIGGSTSAPGTPLEFMTQKNAYSANTSTWKTPPYTFKLTLTIEGTSFGDSADETVVLNDCLFVGDPSEAVDGNTLSCNLQIFGSIVITNSTGTATYNEIS